MTFLFERSKGGEKALLLQPLLTRADHEDALTEFAELTRSAGAQVMGVLTARVIHPDPGFYIGKGKVQELKDERIRLDADLILVNHALSPAQERNLEKFCECRVVDRTGLILDIFAQRARTHEGKLQVELAQLRHLSTRLVRGWTHLERQRGGAIGLRGPGETQLELDRRLVGQQMKRLEKRLDKIQVQHQQARRARQKAAVPVVAVVGYTNAGKSTLFNALTEAGVYAADQLFATLDPTVRKLTGLSSGPAVIADTVGFVRDLPHDLVAAFRSTLAEAREADLLIHVIDAHDPLREDRIEAVNQVLDDIGAGEIPQIQVWNKIDLLVDVEAKIDWVIAGKVRRVWMSAALSAGMKELRIAIDEHFSQSRIHQWIHLPITAGRLRARLFELDAIRNEVIDEKGWKLEVDAPTYKIQTLFGLPDGEGMWLRQVLNDPK